MFLAGSTRTSATPAWYSAAIDESFARSTFLRRRNASALRRLAALSAFERRLEAARRLQRVTQSEALSVHQLAQVGMVALAQQATQLRVGPVGTARPPCGFGSRARSADASHARRLPSQRPPGRPPGSGAGWPEAIRRSGITSPLPDWRPRALTLDLCANRCNSRSTRGAAVAAPLVFAGARPATALRRLEDRLDLWLEGRGCGQLLLADQHERRQDAHRGHAGADPEGRLEAGRERLRNGLSRAPSRRSTARSRPRRALRSRVRRRSAATC